jgi:hypothetical protein
MGARTILVPPKPVYPLQGQAVTPLGRPVAMRSSAAERRRRNLTYLATFNIVTFLVGLIPAMRWLLVPHLAGDILLILYLGLAVYMTAGPSRNERIAQRPAEVVPQQVAEGGF